MLKWEILYLYCSIGQAYSHLLQMRKLQLVLTLPSWLRGFCQGMFPVAPLSWSTHLIVISPAAVHWQWAAVALSRLPAISNQAQPLQEFECWYVKMELEQCSQCPCVQRSPPPFCSENQARYWYFPTEYSAWMPLPSQCQSKAYLSIIHIPLSLCYSALHQHNNSIFLKHNNKGHGSVNSSIDNN